MKRFLFATAAAVSFGLAGAAHAQDLTQPVPTPPPVQASAQTTDNLEGELGTLAQTPQSDTSVDAEIQTDTVTGEQAAQTAEAMAASPAMQATAETNTLAPTLPPPTQSANRASPRCISAGAAHLPSKTGTPSNMR